MLLRISHELILLILGFFQQRNDSLKTFNLFRLASHLVDNIQNAKEIRRD